MLFLNKSRIDPCEGLEILQRVAVVQMVLSRTGIEAQRHIGEDLGDQNAPEMFRLAQISKPGPFEPQSHRLGDFIGVRREAGLVAMAGQRMGFCGWVEISGVCVHPEYRGCGLARSLMVQMINRVLGQGARPFLHTYAENSPAIRLYEQLGFEIRTELNFASLGYIGQT